MYYRWGPYFEQDMQNPEYAQYIKEVDDYQQAQVLQRGTTDIDETETTIQVRCTECHEVHEEHIIAESLGDYISNGDGTYRTLVGECAKCLGA